MKGHGDIIKQSDAGRKYMGEEKKEVEQEIIDVCMVIGGFVGMILSPLLFNLLGTGSFILFFISILCIIIGLIRIMLDKYNDKAAHAANINAFQKEYDEYVDKLGIVKSDTQVTLFETDEDDFESDIPHYLWMDERMLKIFPMSQYYKEYETSSMSKPAISDLKLKSIPMDSILYFEEVGELRKYTTVSGGGSSLKGALLGYAIAEDVGAIIGSREPITTNIVSEDDRRIELIYKNQKGQIENLEFKHDAYDVFKKLMPLKELRKIVSLNTVQDIREGDHNDIQTYRTAKDKLKQLKELQNEGLITEEDFAERKKKILEAI